MYLPSIVPLFLGHELTPTTAYLGGTSAHSPIRIIGHIDKSGTVRDKYLLGSFGCLVI